MNKYLILVLALIFIVPQAQAMEERNTLGVVGAAIIGGILLGKYALNLLWQPTAPNDVEEFSSEELGLEELGPEEPNLFLTLPEEIRAYIITLIQQGITGRSLKEVGKTINALAQVDKALNTQINNRHYTLQLIKHLAKRFNCSDEEAAKALQTEAAKRQLTLQGQLRQICTSPFHSNDPALLAKLTQSLERLVRLGVDLNFTYPSAEGWGTWTPLMLCFRGRIYFNLIFYLLEHNADINQQNNQGKTALMLCASNGYIMLGGNFNEWRHFFKTTHLDINVQDIMGNTVLIYIMKYYVDHVTYPNGFSQPPVKMSAIALLRIIQELLAIGADPTLGNFKGETPLGLAQEFEDPEVIKLIEEAIETKQGS